MKKVKAVMQAPGESGTDDETSDKRKKVSKREYLLADGSLAERIEEATGARYSLLGGANGAIDFDQQFGEAGKLTTMCAIFGFHTKVGNVANTVLNDKNDPGTADDAAAAITDFIKTAEAGTWAERSGGVGVKIDKDALAGAIVDAFGEAGTTVDYAKVRDKLEDPAMVRKFRQNPEIAAKYAERVGKSVTLDDLAGSL